MKYPRLYLIIIISIILYCDVFAQSNTPGISDIPTTSLHNHFTAKQGLIVESNRVIEWRDVSGNGFHLIVPVHISTDFTGPRIDLESLNGFAVPRWLENSGMRLQIDSFFPSSSLPTTDTNMFYAVIKAPHNQGNWRFFWDAASAYARQPLYTTYSDGRWWVRNGSIFTYVNAPDNKWVIVSIRYRTSTATDQGAQVYINGVLVSENPNEVRMSSQDGIRFGSAGGERPPFDWSYSIPGNQGHLDTNRLYYWRVRQSGPSESVWSRIRSFTTGLVSTL